ncbi:ubiquitin-activating enzyme E1-like [[Candida] jaroonii]|uniref:Ubiquitin-activating enzyme E1-like n=1 Tax=[Candida] jaroonii TaxID=467808 RepID=A0ACA9Y5R2_9ASCO|nr:ubiquitin-activating enzyme E1-like [[Candida] jaroonii]
MAKDTYLKKVLGEERFNHIKASKVLMVGAGGIGCELIKNLMLTGFGEIHIVDLDTITLSNLNRQFLFRQKDINKSKAMILVKAVEKFNYFDCKLIPHHGNIMNTELFPISWWSSFDYIYNALDNVEARTYVNSIALFLKKPLMESGTTGFQGQVLPIYPYQSECFDCIPKDTPTTYPVCTIRSTPSKPVHCITWAKEFLFMQLFDEVQILSPEKLAEQRKILESETTDKKEIDNLMNETNELNDLRKLTSSTIEEFMDNLVNKIFVKDIEKLIRIDSLWKYRKQPVPLDYATYNSELSSMVKSTSSDVLHNETKVWSILENLYVLYQASKSLIDRIQSGEKFISFDKDDDDTLNFVVSASNLRSSIFGIDVMSKFDIKQIAGNIIPAIATTNAIISGFSDLQSLNYFKSYELSNQDANTVFVSMKPNRFVARATLASPNPQCASCSLSSRGIMSLSSLDGTLQELIDNIKEFYKYEDISLILGKNKLIYDFDFEDNVDRSLNSLGFKSGETLLVQDDNDELENLELYIIIGEEFKLPELTLRAKKVFKEETDAEDDEPIEEGVVDDIIEVEPPIKKQKV